MVDDKPGFWRGGEWITYGSGESPTGKWQNVVNASWPPPEIARREGDRPHDQWIDVQVRIVFEHDGEVWLNGQASRWVNRRGMRHVMVNVYDPRLQVWRVWVAPEDVRRV